MVRDLTHASSAEGAAWLALLALRSSVADAFPLSDKYLLPPGPDPMPAARAVALLAQQDKPLHCAAEVHGDRLALACRALSPEESEFRRMWTAHREAEGGGWRHLRVRIGERPGRVLCTGRGEPLLVTLPAVERWECDYFRFGSGVSCAADAPDSDWARHHAVQALAQGVGADYVLRLSHSESAGFVVPLAPLWSFPFRFARALRASRSRPAGPTLRTLA